MDHLPRLHAILASDPPRLRVLHQVASLGLSDCWVAAGFVRNAVWDHLHQHPQSTPLADIDVIWFDPARACAEVDRELEAALRVMDSTRNWSVKNQARMHGRNADQPYASATDAMRYWPETATAVAVRLHADAGIEVAAPLGLDDLFDLLVRATARFQSDKQLLFDQRVHSKNWLATWPKLRVV